MSEVTIATNGRNGFRRRLMTTASAAVLLACVAISSNAGAADDDAVAPFWIELGGQFAHQEIGQENFLPAFVLATPRPPFITASPDGVQKPPPSSWDGTLKIAYEPVGTDWVFSAAVLYGKSNRSRTLNQQTAHASHTSCCVYNAYQIINAKNSETHTLLDFRAGKDVGLGSGAGSVLSLGVRYAQFDSRSAVGIMSQPTNVNSYGYYHIFRANFAAERKFTGIGPSVAWDASANLFGNPSEGRITLDGGVDGAVLFGRQRASLHHQTTNNYKHNIHYLSITQTHASPSRSKQVTVPNFGGFAGVSWRSPGAKVSVGYRADFFFGAMDGGIDTAHRENVGFYGPFATVSIGIGG
jgi:hypothetical protein